MKLFISWSGPQSKALAETFKEWIPSVIQAVKPYFSPDDINKGARWSQEIAKELEASKVGVICVTRDNLNAPWIMFEAGALSKNLEKSRVCPIIFGFDTIEIQGPLLQFQAAEFNKSEIKKLLKTINESLDGSALESGVLDNVFEMFWPKLEKSVSEIMKRFEKSTGNVSTRTEKDMLKELLKISRSLYEQVQSSPKKVEQQSALTYEPVLFDEDDWSIKFYDGRGEVYDFELGGLSSGSQITDWIFQINAKTWCTPFHIKAFIDLVEELSKKSHDINAQGLFCPFGKNLEVKWPTK